MKLLFPIAAALTVLCAAPASAAPAMWEVSDGDSGVWLFGSVHILTPDIEWRTPVFDDKLAQANAVYFEADIGPLGQIALTFQMAGIMADARNHPWVHLLSDEQMDKLELALLKAGMSLEQVSVMPPWLAAMSIQVQTLMADGYQADKGVDVLLQTELPKERKAYFETAAEQIGLISGSTIEEGIEMLMFILEPREGLTVTVDEMVADWASGETMDVSKMIGEDIAYDAESMDRFLYDRNRNWLPIIEEMLSANEQDLIVVGAAHLAGDGSVIDLLEKAGYTVARIQ
jgi:uncharacterized protein